MLQRGGVCCSVVECVAVFCEAAATCLIEFVAVRSVVAVLLQCCCSVVAVLLQCVAVFCEAAATCLIEFVAVRSVVAVLLQCCCSVLQCDAV